MISRLETLKRVLVANPKNSCNEIKFPGAAKKVSRSIRRVLIERIRKAPDTLGAQNDPTLYDGDCVIVADSNDAGMRNCQLLRAHQDGPPFGLQLVGGSAAGNSLLSSGIFVAHVVPGSEAQRLGFRLGDQLLEVNGIPLVGRISCCSSSSSMFKEKIRHRGPPSLDSNNVSELLKVAALIGDQVSLLVMSAKDEKRQSERRQMLIEEEEEEEVEEEEAEAEAEEVVKLGEEKRINLASSKLIHRKNCREIDESKFEEGDANNEFKRSTKQFEREKNLHLMVLNQQQLQLQRQYQYQLQQYLNQDTGSWRFTVVSK